MNERKNENLDIEIIDDFVLEETTEINIPPRSSIEPMSNNQVNRTVNPQPSQVNNTEGQASPSRPTPMPNNPQRSATPAPMPNPGTTREPQAMPNQDPRTNVVEPGEAPKKPPKKKKNRMPVIIILLILILVGIGFYIYYIVASNPKQLMVKGINKLTSNIEYLYEPFSKNKVNIEESKTTSGNITFDLKLNLGNVFPVDQSMEELINMVTDNLNKTTISYNYQKDVDNKKMLLSLMGNLKEEELFNFKLFNENNKQYIFLKDIFDKYIEIATLDELEKRDMVETVEDMTYFWRTVLESLMKNIKSSYYTTEKTIINLDGVETNVKKTTLILNEENQKELYKLVISQIKNDKRAMEIDSKYDLGLKEINVEEEINSGTFDQEFNYSIYYKDVTNELLMLDFENITAKQKIVYTFGNEETIEFFDSENSTYKVTLKMEKDKFTINAKISEDSIITIKGQQNEGNYTYSWNLISNEYTITGEFVLKTEIIKEGIEYNTSRDFNIKVSQKGEELITFNITDSGKTVKDAKVNENIGETVHYENLTNEDMNEIMAGLYSIVMRFLAN